MAKFFTFLMVGLIAVVLVLLAFALIKKDIYDKLNAIFAMNTNIVLLIMVLGFIDGRMDMYIDIALSYSILGFVTTVILAKYIGGRK
jgi:multicomponent Na+:H+ antiporter subunit F